jgi:hypothetical protein
MAFTKTKLTLSIDSGLVKRLHKFMEDNPGHPSISALFEQTLTGYIDHFSPMLERARNGDAEAAIAMMESSIFRVSGPLRKMTDDVMNLRTEWEVQKKQVTQNPKPPTKKTKKKSV